MGRVGRRGVLSFYGQPVVLAGKDEPPAPAPAPSPAPAPAREDPLVTLQRLAELKSEGVLTDEEFAKAKARVLDS